MPCLAGDLVVCTTGLPILPFPLQTLCRDVFWFVAVGTEHAEDNVRDENAGYDTGNNRCNLICSQAVSNELSS